MAARRRSGRWRARSAIPLLGEVAAGKPMEMFSVEESARCPGVAVARPQGVRAARAWAVDDRCRHPRWRLPDRRAERECGRRAHGRGRNRRAGHGEEALPLARRSGAAAAGEPEMLPLIVSGDQVRIRGVVVGVLRKYGFMSGPPANNRRRAPAPAATARPARRAPADAKRSICRSTPSTRSSNAGASSARISASRNARERAEMALAGARPAGAARVVCAHDQAGAAPRDPRRCQPHHPAHAALCSRALADLAIRRLDPSWSARAARGSPHGPPQRLSCWSVGDRTSVGVTDGSAHGQSSTGKWRW